MALVRPENFTKTVEGGTEVYTAEISYPIDRENLLARWEVWQEQAGPFGFHYTPYNFDSGPEMSFFEQMLKHLNLKADHVEDIYFTGALTDPEKTDFYVEYRGEDGRWHRYTPDFIIRRKDGRCLIVEIKDARFASATKEDLARAGRGQPALTLEGRKAVALHRWQELNPDRLKYNLLFVHEETVAYDHTRVARDFVEGRE